MKIVDGRSDQSYVVKMNVNALDDKKMRLDIFHTFKGHLVSLVLRKKIIEYLLIPTKQFYSGPVSSESLTPLVPLPFHPALFYNLFFRRPITQTGWTCSKNKGLLSRCESKQFQIRWMDSKIFVRHKWGQLQIHISRFLPKVLEKEDLFILKKPKSFRFEGL